METSVWILNVDIMHTGRDGECLKTVLALMNQGGWELSSVSSPYKPSRKPKMSKPQFVPSR